MSAHRILVTGSRDWDDAKTIAETLKYEFIINNRNKNMILVTGACPTGADLLAEQAWHAQGFAIERHPADWQRYGKGAGFIRNQHMVDLGANVCYAFLRNGSKGTQHCIDRAQLAGIPVFIERYRY